MQLRVRVNKETRKGGKLGMGNIFNGRLTRTLPEACYDISDVVQLNLGS